MKIRSLAAGLALTVLAPAGAIASASATSAGEPCVPSPAIPAVPPTPGTPAVTTTIPATPDLWWNWSPNKHQGPFDGPPAFPVDPRGTWQGPHANGGPSQGTYGTFQQGNGHGSWFHREKGTPEQVIVVTPAVPGTPGSPAVPAVTCDDPTTPSNPSTPPTPTTPDNPDQPDNPGQPEQPTTPDNPGQPDQPVEQPTPEIGTGVVTSTYCADGVFLTETFEDGELIDSSASGSCEVTRANAVRQFSVAETGF